VKRQADQQKEISDDLAAGYTASEIAAVQATQAQEKLAIATDRSRTAAAAAAASLQAIGDAMESLTERDLTATGQAAAAGQANQLYSQQQETAKDTALGFTPDPLAFLSKTQLDERNASEQTAQAAAQAAFDAAQKANASATDTATTVAASPTSFNLAVGTSEATSATISGYLASSITYWQRMNANLDAINRNTQELHEIRDFNRDMVALLRSSTGNTSSEKDLDETLAGFFATGNKVAGNPPWNV
jgi:hypothetical protein